MIDAVVENLVVESENLMPNILEIQADTFWRFGRKRIHNRNQHRFSVHASQIQCDLKDVAYYIKKKQGFPSIKDTGVMDVFLGGEGLSFDMKLATALPKDRNRIFLVENVNVKVRNLNIVLKKSNHKTLFNFFKPLLMGVMKPAIAKAAEIQIRKSFDQLDEQMWLVQKEYNKAKEAAKDQPPEETANMVKMYINAIEKRITDLKEKAEKKTSNTKVLTFVCITLTVRSTSPILEKLRSSRTSNFLAVSQRKPPNIVRWLVRVTNGDLRFSTLAPLKHPTFRHPRRLLAGHLIRTRAPQLTIVPVRLLTAQEDNQSVLRPTQVAHRSAPVLRE
jgi:hypothetical protein